MVLGGGNPEGAPATLDLFDSGVGLGKDGFTGLARAGGGLMGEGRKEDFAS